MTTRKTTLSALRGRRDLKSRALVYFLVFSLISPSPTFAINMSGLKSSQGFIAAALAVAFVNKAMREASENPMDAWRRQNVAHAIGMLPIGIRALASEFQSGKLHDGDLKYVTGILGGFVDMSAPDQFQKFMKTPDKSLIPQLGANFPQEIMRQADQQGFPSQGQSSKSIVFDESAKGNEQKLGLDSKSSVPAASQEIANLNAIVKESSSPSSGKSGEAHQKGATSKSIVFDEDAPKDPSGYYSTASAVGNGLPANAGSPSNFESSIARDIASVESQLGFKPSAVGSPAQGLSSGVTVVKTTQGVEKSVLSDDFFVEKKVPKKEVSRRDPANYKTKIRPKYWKMVPLLMLLVKDAGAAPGAAPAAPGANGGDQGSGCKGGGKCGGGGEKGGEGGGGGGADFLFGLAAMIAAAAPMVAAAIQADADKKVAKINAEAQVTMAGISAENSKYMADSQSRIAQQQNQIAQDINKKNNDEQTKRLAMQLNEVKSGREQAYQSELAKREEERKLNEERIALAQRQADDQLKLARASFNAQLTQAGLSSGMTNVSRPGGNLTVQNNVQAGRTTASTNVTNSTGSIGSNFGNSNFTGPNLAANSGTASGTTTGGTQAASGQAVMRGIASEKLVASAKTSRGVTGEEDEEEVDPNDPNKKRKPKRRTTASLRGVRSLYRGAYSVTTRTTAPGTVQGTIAYTDVALGSTRGFKAVITTPNGTEKIESDLEKFANQATATNRGFAAWKSIQPTPVGQEVQQATSRGVSPRTASPTTGAYNAPDLGTHGGGTRSVY